MASSPKPAKQFIIEQQADLRRRLPFADTQDFEDATAAWSRRSTRARAREDGRVLWDNSTLRVPGRRRPGHGEPEPVAAVAAGRDATACSRSSRASTRCAGWTCRTSRFVEGDEGVVVIDPLISAETARGSAGPVPQAPRRPAGQGGRLHPLPRRPLRRRQGLRPPRTTSTPDRCRSSRPRVSSSTRSSENVYAGTAMGRRAGYMYGAALARGPQGAGRRRARPDHLDRRRSTLIAPTATSPRPAQEETVDGVRMVFQMAPGTEAPAEMLFYFPDFKALCAAEDATHTLHNLLTLRGAVVRDPHAWSNYLTETIDLFGGEVEVVFASHHWPTWGNERVVEFLSTQRDLYAYLHDQTLRLLNQGLVGRRDRRADRSCRRRWRTPGTPTATTARSATTSRRSTSATWAGSTATPRTCGSTRPVEQAHAVRRAHAAAPTPSSRRPARRSTPATTAGPPKCSTTWCSPSPTTQRPANCSPTPTSSSATAPRTAPGATSTSPARPSCATASSAPRP